MDASRRRSQMAQEMGRDDLVAQEVALQEVLTAEYLTGKQARRLNRKLDQVDQSEGSIKKPFPT